MKHWILWLAFASSLPNALQAKGPIVIAHRGASGYLPEHTLEAKVLAHAMRADFIEQDVVLSKDAIPMVLHDIYVDTISDVGTRYPHRKRDDGRYYAIDFTLAELKTLEVCERFNAKTGEVVFGDRFPKGQSSFEIATLEEELQLIQGLNRTRMSSTGIYTEIKQPAWHQEQGYDISKIVLELLHRYDYKVKSDLCWLQCFEYEEIKRIRTELHWEGKLVLLVGSFHRGTETAEVFDLETDDGMQAIAKFVDGIGPAIGLVISGKSPSDRQITSLTGRAHNLGLQVHPYTLRIDELPKTVSSADDLMQLLFSEAKVDGLFTDFPDLTVNWLSKR